jgi:hypothetical protein
LKVFINSFFVTVFIIALFSITSNADELYLKDSKVIKCKIIRITDNNIEYAEQNGNPFLILPKNQVSKIIYENGDVFQITEDNEVKQIATIPPKEKKINTSESKYKCYITLPSGGLGYNSNPDIGKWAKYRSQQYVDYLKSADIRYANAYSTSQTNEHSLANLTLEASLFFNNTFGIGIAAGYLYTDADRKIKGQSVLKQLTFNTRFESYYFGISSYYKKPIKTNTALTPYLLLGIGINYYYMIYDNNVTYGSGDDTHKGPYSELFDEKFRGNCIGYHGIAGFGFEFYHFSVFSSFFIPYATASTFKSGDKEMRFANGSKVSGRFAGFVFQIGCAVNFSI